MAVYGFDYSKIFFLLSVKAVNPVVNGAVDLSYNTAYTYNANAPLYGNPVIPTLSSALNDNNYNTNFPDWISNLNTDLDVRGFYLVAANATGVTKLNCEPSGQYCQVFDWPPP